MKIDKKLIKQVKSVYDLEVSIKEFEKQLEPLKTKLKKKFPYGVFKVGKYQVIKTLVEPCIIPEVHRVGYDSLQIK